MAATNRSAARTLAVLALLLATLPFGCSSSSAASDAAAAAVKLEERSFIDGHVKLLVPVDFEPMAETPGDAKAATAHAPIVALRSPDHSAALFVMLRRSESVRPGRDLDDATAELVRWIDDALKRPRNTTVWYRNEAVIRDGRGFLLCDLSAARDYVDHRAILTTTTMNQQSLEIGFVFPQPQSSTWGSIGKHIIETVSVRD